MHHKLLKNTFFRLIISLLPVAHASAQTLARIEVEMNKGSEGIDVPVYCSLDEITTLPDTSIALFEVTGNSRTPVPCQVTNKMVRMLHWLVNAQSSARKKVYELVKTSSQNFSIPVRVEEKDGALTFKAGEKNLLRYNYRTVYPPAGVDTVFRRSGFIHPLWSPHGQELTWKSPPDHYHHFGLWNPWTKVLFEGDTIDFWNLGAKKGTVRFANFVSVADGPVFAEFQALHEHVAFKKGNEQVAMNELQTVRIYNPPGNKNYYIVDITIQLNTRSNQLILEEYRYGGLGWRATQKWNKDNSETLTSEGKTRKDADGSKARWCIVQGTIDNDYAGIVLMSYPTNYNFPEPLRVWPESMNGRGDVFVNFSPTKDKDWKLDKDKDYLLKYRLVIYNGRFSGPVAEAGWQYFAQPPRITIKKINNTQTR